MRLENVMMAGYNQCPAFKWLHENGGIEGRFEMQTVVTSNQEAVYDALQKVKDRWMSNEFGPEVCRATSTTSLLVKTKAKGKVKKKGKDIIAKRPAGFLAGSFLVRA